MKFSMSPDSLLPFLFLSCFLLPLSVACPESFHCGHLGEIYFPFTDARSPDCGLLPITGCDAPEPEARKEVQLGNDVWFDINIIDQKDYLNEIVVIDPELRERLNSNTCSAFDYKLPIPRESPTMSFHILNSIPLLRCNHPINNGNVFEYSSQHACPGYNISFPPPAIDGKSPRPLKACSVIQLPVKPQPPYPANDPLTFLTAEIYIEVQLSDSCHDCVYIRGGQCLPDGKCSADEHKGSDSKALIKEHKERESKALKKGVAIGSAAVIIIFLLIILPLMVQRYNCSGFLNQSRNIYFDIHPSTNPENGNVNFGVPVFSYRELEEATNNFDQSRELGNGGFGTVYYGKLKDGREVAVKRVYDHKRDSKRVKQFMNEIQVFTHLRHRNLVSLYGCTSPHSHKLLLAYEYIPNGTVASHLHGDLAKPGSLPWPLRMKIAIEIATALTYLHASNIIHRDVKTNNILLDKNFCVKVADFGISRLLSIDVSHASTAPQGTMGYVDPEYQQSYQLTNKSDVYSFGVVLIELISSMQAVDPTRNIDEIKLANLALKKIQRREFTELVDSSLGFESNSEYKRMIVSMAELAFHCLQRDKELRPSMDKVLEALQKIESGKDELEPLEVHGIGILHKDIHTAPSTSHNWNEVGSLKNLKGQQLRQTF